MPPRTYPSPSNRNWTLSLPQLFKLYLWRNLVHLSGTHHSPAGLMAQWQCRPAARTGVVASVFLRMRANYGPDGFPAPGCDFYGSGSLPLFQKSLLLVPTKFEIIGIARFVFFQVRDMRSWNISVLFDPVRWFYLYNIGLIGWKCL